MTDLEQLRLQAQQFLSRIGGDAATPADAVWKARAIIIIAMLASIGIYVLLWDVPSWSIAMLMIAAIVAVLGRSHLGAFAVLVWAWIAAPFDELRWSGEFYPQDRLFLQDWIAATALLAFLMFAFRLVELPQTSGDGSLPWLSRSRPPESRTRGPHLLLFPFSGAALRLIAAPAAAMLCLWVLSLNSMRENQVQLYAPFYRAIIFFWTIGVVGFVAGAAFSILRWRRLTPRQGSIYARWVILDAWRREQAAVERARARRLRRRDSGDRP
jgi:hypothetical protein